MGMFCISEKSLYERLGGYDAAARFRRIERRAKCETGQRFFWRPGRRGPERVPDLGAALRG